MQKLLLTTLLFFIVTSVFSQKHESITFELTVNSDKETKKEHLSAIFDLISQNQDSALRMLMDFKDKIKSEEKEISIRYQSVLAFYYWNTNRLDTAAMLYAENIDTAEKYQLLDRKINAMSNLGAILNVMGWYDSAYFYLNKSLPLAIELGDSSIVSKIRFDIGNYFKNKAYYHLALEQLLLSKEYYDRHSETPILVYNLNSLGTLYSALEDSKKAKYYFHSAIKMDSARDDVFLLHDIFNNLGVCLWKLDQEYDSARYYLQKSYDINLQYHSSEHQLVNLLNLGGLESDVGNLQSSLAYLLKAEKLKYQVDNPYKISALYINLGAIYTKRKEYKKASRYYQDGLQLAESIGAIDNMKTAYSGFSTLDSLQGNYLSVLKTNQIIAQLNDSIHSLEVNKKIAELEIIYQTKEKEKENNLLQNQNLLQSKVIHTQKIINYLVGFGSLLLLLYTALLLFNRKKLKLAKKQTEEKNREIVNQNIIIEEKNQFLEEQAVELTDLNITKDKFFAIIAHDLKNPFSSLLGLLDILESDFNSLPDSKKLEIIQNLTKSGRNTYNMLVNLLDWARSQNGRIEAKTEVLQLFKVVNAALVFLNPRIKDKEHQVIMDFDPAIQVWADEHLLLTVCINIINNALKFTKRRGTIEIGAKPLGERLVISIRDNGVGMTQEHLKDLFKTSSKLSTRGTEDERGTGLGLILAKEFVALMNGTIRAESETGKGSTFYIELPKAMS